MKEIKIQVRLSYISGFIDLELSFFYFRSDRNRSSCLPTPKELVFSSWQYRLIGAVLPAYCICNRTVVCSRSVKIVEDQPVDSAVVSLQLSVGCTLGNCCSINTGNTEDRKSTRLNSSHVAISYAVFCLKK